MLMSYLDSFLPLSAGNSTTFMSTKTIVLLRVSKIFRHTVLKLHIYIQQLYWWRFLRFARLLFSQSFYCPISVFKINRVSYTSVFMRNLLTYNQMTKRVQREKGVGFKSYSIYLTCIFCALQGKYSKSCTKRRRLIHLNRTALMNDKHRLTNICHTFTEYFIDVFENRTRFMIT